jgi:Arc/MetJ-type ribon-helix-helix transcriptional regulator
MRINRTFSIPVELVHELKKKHNQSETVTRALRKYLDSNEAESLDDASLRNILAELRLRFEPKSPEMEILKTLIAITF